MSRPDTFASGVLGLLVFVGFNLFLPEHLVLIFPVVLFLGFLGILGGAENCVKVQIRCYISSKDVCIS